jgi:hypothetical protein
MAIAMTAEERTAALAALNARTGLDEALKVVFVELPREQWPTARLHPNASHWLEIHGWFRGMATELVRGAQDQQAGKLEPGAFFNWAVPRLNAFLGNLDGHHKIESHHYFPALTILEPRLAKGFELLDRDHGAIDGLLHGLAQAGQGLQGALVAGDPEAAKVGAERTAKAIEACLQPLTRHLHDEEDLIIPLLTLRGDPVTKT